MSLLSFAHIAGGSLSLLSLLAAMFSKKGGRLHRRAGKLFSWGMGVTLLSGVYASLRHLVDGNPDNDLWSLLLLQAALLTGAGLDFGRLVLVAKRRSTSFPRRRSLPLPLALSASSVGLASISIPRGNALLVSFAGLGLVLAAGQLYHWFKRAPAPNEWLVAHVTGMGTAGIGAVTAFCVVNAARLLPNVPSLVVWLLPGAVGGVWIGIVTRRLKRGRAGGSAQATTSGV